MGDHDTEEFERLYRFVTRPGARFGLGLATHADASAGAEVRTRLLDELVAEGRRVESIELGFDDDERDIVRSLVEAAARSDVVFVAGLEYLVSTPGGQSRGTNAIASLNFRRDELPELVDARVVFWIAAGSYAHLASVAWDLVQVMLTRFEFVERRAPEPQPVESAAPPPDWLVFATESEAPSLRRQADSLSGTAETTQDHVTAADAAASAGVIYASLGKHELAVEWMQRAANIYEACGPNDSSLLLRAAQQRRRLAELHVFAGSGEAALQEVLDAIDDAKRSLEVATTASDPYASREAERQVLRSVETQADISRRLGDLDAALRIRKQELLPALLRLGDLRMQAQNMGALAQILGDLGQVDEALGVWSEQVLPIYERLDDARSCAVTKGEIADLLERRGELEEALRVRQQQVLPVFEKLGDAMGSVATLDKIADILFKRGELDEAQRIREQELIPAYQRLNDERACAATIGKIADGLVSRGQLDEALRLRTHEELPTYERLEDAHSRAITWGKIAEIFDAQDDPEAALRVRLYEQLPIYHNLRNFKARSDVVHRIMAAARDRVARAGVDEAARAGVMTLLGELRGEFERFRVPELVDLVELEVMIAQLDEASAAGGTSAAIGSAKRGLLIRGHAGGLRGVDNDIRRFSMLLDEYGFDDVAIVSSPTTREHILDGLHGLLARSRAGDTVVVYYTGHAGYVSFSGVDGVDENRVWGYFVPETLPQSDPRSSEDFRGVLGIEVSTLCSELARIGASVTLIVDATWAPLVTAGRGSSNLSIAIVSTTVRELLSGISDDNSFDDEDVVVVVADRRGTSVYETNLPPYIGVFTHELCEVLSGHGGQRLSWVRAVDQTRLRIWERLGTAAQDPVVLGPGRREVFGTNVVDEPTSSAIIHASEDLVVLAGQLHGFGEGDELDIIDDQELRATSSIVEAQVDRSRVTLSSGAVEPTIHSMARLRSRANRMPVQLTGEDPALAELEALLQGSAWVRAAEVGEAGALQVGINHGQLHLIASPADPGITRTLRPELVGPARVRWVFDDLESLVKARRFEQVCASAPVPPPDMADMADMEFWIRGAHGGESRRVASHGETLFAGDLVSFRVRHAGGPTAHAVYVSIIDRGVSGRCTLLRSNADSRRVGDSGQRSDFRLTWPPDVPRQPCREVLYVVATSRPVDLGMLVGSPDSTPITRARALGPPVSRINLRAGEVPKKGPPLRPLMPQPPLDSLEWYVARVEFVLEPGDR